MPGASQPFCRNTPPPVPFHSRPAAGSATSQTSYGSHWANVSFKEQTVRGRFTFLAILAIAAALFAADQSLAAVATGPSNYFNESDSYSLFTAKARFLIRSPAPRTQLPRRSRTLSARSASRQTVPQFRGQQAYVESYDTVTEGGMGDYYLTGYAAWLYTNALDAIEPDRTTPAVRSPRESAATPKCFGWPV